MFAAAAVRQSAHRARKHGYKFLDGFDVVRALFNTPWSVATTCNPPVKRIPVGIKHETPDLFVPSVARDRAKSPESMLIS